MLLRHANLQRSPKSNAHFAYKASWAVFLDAYEEFYEHVITNFSEGFSLQNDCDLLRQYKLRWSNESLSLHASSFQTTNAVSISAAQWETSERLFYGFIKLHWYKYHPSIPHALFQLTALISILTPTIKMIKHLLWLLQCGKRNLALLLKTKLACRLLVGTFAK